jgi:hypothetical protein
MIQATRLGSDLVSRFCLSYRPYGSKNGAREWFIGPALTWLSSQDDRIAGVIQSGSGGDVLLAGLTTFVGLRPGMHIWLGMDWDVAHSTGANVHAYAPSRQFRNYATVSAAPLRKGGTMNTKKLALLALFGSMVVPVAQAQIKHIEMRVEGMT